MFLACLVAVIGYLIGSLSFSNFAARRLANIDLLTFGSKNAGASNLGQLLGSKAMIVVGCLDLAKGAATLAVGGFSPLPPEYLILLGCAVIAGHCWSCFLRFKGGRGIASLTGVILGLGWFGVLWSSLLIASVGLVFGNRPVYVALAVLSMPLTGWVFDKDFLGLGFLTAIVFMKRILGNNLTPESPDGILRGYLRRAVFDRDITSNEGWVRREYTGK